MRIRLPRLIAGLLLLASMAGVQAQQFVLHAYRQDEGLGNLAISALAFDRAGFLWVGTENGVYRFLGSRFERFGAEQGIVERDIQDVFAAPDGTVWVGTYGNLYRWTGQRFQPATTKPIHVWRSEHIAAVSPGQLLVIDDKHLGRLRYDLRGNGPDGRTLGYELALSASMDSAQQESQHLGSLHIDAGGTVWLGCGTEVCSLHDGRLKHWGRSAAVPAETWFSLLRDREGTLWAVSEHHVIALKSSEDRFVERTPAGGDPNSVVRRAPIALDHQGRIIVSTQQGLSRWEGSSWKWIGKGNDLQSSYVTAIRFDANGDAWLGSSGHGLYHWIGYNDWEGWADSDGLPSSIIWSLGFFKDNKAFLGTERGPAQIDLTTGATQKLTTQTKWDYGQVSGMELDAHGDIITGSFSGTVLRIHPQTRAVTQVAKLPDLVFNTVQDSAGHIFLPSSHGIYQIDETALNAKPSALPEVNALFKDITGVYNGCAAKDGSTWFVTDSHVIERSRTGQWSLPKISGFPNAMQALADISCAVDGSLWVTGYQSGTWHLTRQGNGLAAVELPLPEEDSELAPMAVLSDKRGWLWLGTDDGVLAWNGSSWRHLTRESGLIWNDINSCRLAEAPDGSIWFGTSGGLGHLLHPARVFDPVTLPLALIAVRRGAQVFPADAQFTLPWSKQDLSFEFATPSTLNRSDLSFSYRIAELDSEWTDTESTTSEFQALPPGKYTFEVFARNRARSVRSETVAISFRVLPPWWRTIWFYGLCALAFITLLAALYDLRIRHLTNLRRKLEQLVQERTFELVASREEMRIQATHDSLTGLQNRGAILEDLAREIERSHREKISLTIVLADLDLFKEINDNYGHLAGDEALRQFAIALREAIRAYDHVGRYGGEEFLLVMPGIAAAELEDRLARLHRDVSNLKVRSGTLEFQINCSLGAIFIDPAFGPVLPDQALALADRALYAAKQTGRNRIVQSSLASPESREVAV